VRLFVAAELPAGHRASLAGVCERGRRGGVRWVPAENVHLTLKFLGEVDEGMVPDVEEALAAVAVAARPFALALEGGGCFPNARSPRVIWVGAGEGVEQLRGYGAAAAEVRALALIKSTLTPEGAVYDEVRRFELGAD
jgi:2'-5' RNA ligase